MEIKYKPVVVKQLKKLSLDERKKVFRKIESLKNSPYAGKMLKGEFEGLSALRAWPYRIIYELKSSIIIIYSVAHRQGVYK